MNILAYLLLISVAARNVISEELHEQNHDGIDPIKQTQDEGEPNEQDKRTLFDTGNRYGIEKHVRLHPSGYKYLLGYRPVKFTYVPVAKPLFKPMQWKWPKVHFSVKPVVSLLPPKTAPVYKPQANYGPPGKLPVNVPPSVPARPWQQEGWTPVETDNRPFVPSLPEPATVSANTFVQQLPHPSVHVFSPPSPGVPVFPQPSPGVPVFPTQPLPTAALPVLPQAPPNLVFPIPSPPPVQVHSVLPKPVVPVAPFPTVHTVVPVQPTVPVNPQFPIQPAIPVQPPLQVNPVGHLPAHSFHHFDNLGRPLVPINLLPGRLNLPVPDLGVLPLGATAPVQLNPALQFSQSAPIQPHFVQKVPQQVFAQEQPILHKFPIPNVVQHQPNFISLHSGFTPIEQPVQPQVHHFLSQPPPQTHVRHEFVPQLPVQPHIHQELVPQPPVHPHMHQELAPQPSVHPGVYQQPQHHVSISVNRPVPTPAEQQHHGYQQFEHASVPHELHHGYQNFEQARQEHLPQLPSQPTVQQSSQSSSDTRYSHFNYQHVEEQPHQNIPESPGFFQPGKSDLQIPEYLPEHPHLRQTLADYQQDSNIEPYKAK